MPQLGLAMESGRIVAWVKQPGDRIKAGEVLLEVETDKATIEVEAIESGILHVLTPAGDGTVLVGATIGFVLAEGEPAPAQGGEESPVLAAVSPVGASTPSAPIGGAAAGAQRRAASTPAARRSAAELGVDWRQAEPTGTRGQIRARDVQRLATAATSAPAHGIPAPAIAAASDLITPLARRLADSLGIDLALVTSLYPNQRITRDEVEATARRLLRERGASPAPVATATRAPMSSLRRLIAERMAASAHTAAAVTLTTSVDATELVRLRATLRNAPGAGVTPGYNVILAKVLAAALRDHPQLNSTVEGDEIVLWSEVNVGIAVETERGLVVPVLRNVAGKTLAILAVEGDELLGRARDGKARPDELVGGTFTLTNLGGYRIDAFTPIINPPQCAILGVGRIARQLVVSDDDSTAIRSLMTLSLTFDHRVIDGAPAARFLDHVRQLIEQPYLWLTQ
jgi:pyruvate dehydrogenase E2 component (dihydrolipoamide acetyltransferase)